VDRSTISTQNNTPVEACSCTSRNIGVTTYDDIASEEQNLKRTHTIDTYTTEIMIWNCSLTRDSSSEKSRDVVGTFKCFNGTPCQETQRDGKGPDPILKVYKYCTQGKDPEKVKLWTTNVCEEKGM
jgi:hypothetical protein